MKLNCEYNVEIELPNDYNFDMSVNKPSHFSSELVKYDNGELRQAMRFGKVVLGIMWHGENLRIYYENPLPEKTVDQVKEEIIFRYDINGKINDFLQAYRDDDVLSGPISRLWGMHPTCSYSLYEFLMVTTMLQNTTVRRSTQMTDIMLKTYGDKIEFGDEEIYSVWQPEKISMASEEELRALKIGYRAKNVKRISDAFVDNRINETELREMPTDELRKKLLQIYGVGPQTVNYLIFEYFHRYDALDHLSPWESKLISKVIFNDKEHSGDEIVGHLKGKYGGYEALAVLYMIEDLFECRKTEDIDWLEEEIRT